jgi:hypothetical protein
MRLPPNWTWRKPLVGLFGTILLLFGTISGCATPQVVYKEVKIPVPVPCVVSGAVPATPDIPTNSVLNQLDDYAFVLQLATDRLELLRHNGELHALIKACIK